MVLRALPSIVWLCLLDECPMLWSDPSEPLLNVACNFGLGDVDREAGVFIRSLAVQEDELPEEVIERGSGVLGEVAEDGAEAQGRLISDVDAKDVLAGLRLELADDFVGVGRKKAAVS